MGHVASVNVQSISESMVTSMTENAADDFSDVYSTQHADQNKCAVNSSKPASVKVQKYASRNQLELQQGTVMTDKEKTQP